MPTVLDARTVEIIDNISPGADQVGLGTLIDNALSGVLPAGSVSLAEIATAATGQVIRSNGVGVANTWSTVSAGAPAFTGTPATISPTAALNAAPVFSGTPATISPTAVLAAAPTFTGAALAADMVHFIDDDSAATNGTLVWAAVPKGRVEEAVLCSENANNATATLATDNGFLTFVVDKPIGTHNWLITDADGAAGTGVALYAHWTGYGQLAQLKFVSPTNAHGSFTMNNGGDTVPVIDNDGAATEGLIVYCDEDATDGSRLLVSSPTGQDLYFTTTNGRYVKLTHSADPGAVGVQIYFDEDAANSYERLLFVSPTNANCTNANNSAAAWSVMSDETLVALYFDEDATTGYRLLHGASAGVYLKIPAIDATDTLSPRLINIAYSATASVDGVLFYFDDNGATPSQRLLFVSPTDANKNNLLDAKNSYYGIKAAGTNDAPAITVTGASYTPAGTNDAPAITVTGAAYTPAGTVAAPTVSLS